jgi:hypothetical protein
MFLEDCQFKEYTVHHRIFWTWKIKAKIKSFIGTNSSNFFNTFCGQFYIWIFLLALQPPRASVFQFYDRFTDGRTPWTSDQPVARPIPKHRTTQTQNKRIHTRNNHAPSGIRTRDPSVRASEDSSCLRPLGYCDRLLLWIMRFFFVVSTEFNMIFTGIVTQREGTRSIFSPNLFTADDQYS